MYKCKYFATTYIDYVYTIYKKKRQQHVVIVYSTHNEQEKDGNVIQHTSSIESTFLFYSTAPSLFISAKEYVDT